MTVLLRTANRRDFPQAVPEPEYLNIDVFL